jgi:hypothetical protein
MAPSRLLRSRKRPTTERPTIEPEEQSALKPKKRCMKESKKVLVKQLPTIAYLEYLGFDVELIIRPRKTNEGGNSQFKINGPGRCADLTNRAEVRGLLLELGLPWFHPKVDGLTLDKIAKGETAVPGGARPQDGDAPPAKGCVLELIPVEGGDDEAYDSNEDTGDKDEEGSYVQEEDIDEEGGTDGEEADSEEGADEEEADSEEGADEEEKAAVGELDHLRAKYKRCKAEVKDLQEKLQAEQDRCKDLEGELVQITDDYDFVHYHLETLGCWSVDLEKDYMSLEEDYEELKKEYRAVQQMIKHEMKRELVD